MSSYPLVELESSTVDILIDPRRRQWNLEMIDGLFNTEEAELIKIIPLSRETKEDVLFWPHSSDGRYSCKTGYSFLKMEEELNDEPQVTTDDHTLSVESCVVHACSTEGENAAVACLP